MCPVDFFRSHGLIVDHPVNDGRWHRVATEDHPKKRNGAYMLDGERAFCQNWATMPAAVGMRSERDEPQSEADKAAMRERAKARQATQAQDWKRAAERAAGMLAAARPAQSGYLLRKGFSGDCGLVLPDGTTFVPMRDLESNVLVGAQLIDWQTEERVWRKKFLPGMRAQGAVFRLGPAKAPETVLCEGLATGMSIEDAARSMRFNIAVLVCFSAGNIVAVAKRMEGWPGRRFVFADHDSPERDPEKWQKNPGEAGQRSAAATSLPWTMSPREGEDANDLWKRQGQRALAALVMQLRRQTEPTAWTPASQPK